ncbi:hypothetical protein ABW20_dc0109733 [Dactylellina cionopaga]|nr:hypothetical protein ABW20_dc0109733 [Dactylellina cionopaga]
MSLSRQQVLSTYVRDVNLYAGSAPASVVFRGTLYVFYSGAGYDGVWCTTTTDGLTWAPIYNLNQKGARSQSKRKCLQRCVVRLLQWQQKRRNLVLETCQRGSFHSRDFGVEDKWGDRWTPQKKLSCDGDVPNLAANTGLNSVQFLQKPYAFWSSGSGINFSPGFEWEISSSNWARPGALFQDSDSFAVTTSDATLITLLRTKLGDGSATATFTFSSPRPANAVSDFIKRVYSAFQVTDASLATKVSIMTTLIASGPLLQLLQ